MRDDDLEEREAIRVRSEALAARANEAERFVARYTLRLAPGAAVERVAEEIALEQTVEVPDDCIPHAVRAAGVPGRVEAIAERPGGGFEVAISYRTDLAGGSLAGLLNLVYGNVSLIPGVRLVGLDFAPGQLAGLPGPGLGIEGLRRLLGVRDRPITATAIKPLGQPVAVLAALAGAYARGGIDIIKDDHGLHDQRLHPFAERAEACHEAVEAANGRTGGRSLYVPMVAGPPEAVEVQVAFAARLGVRAVMTAPLITGLESVARLARRHGLALLAHPSFAGTFLHDPGHGMTPALLLGTLFRLAGADVSIFPNAGGRFAFGRAECIGIAEALRAPLGRLAPALPAPAGGMALERIGDMVDVFGPDAVLLIGGALIRHDPDPEVAARAFRAALEGALHAREVAS
jgi:ribulose-bisphosphate carboxylase large chain